MVYNILTLKLSLSLSLSTSTSSHIELLVNHHSLTNALTVTGNLLKNLKYQMFVHVVTDHAVRAKGASELMEEYMDASNFGVCEIDVAPRLSTLMLSEGCVYFSKLPYSQKYWRSLNLAVWS